MDEDIESLLDCLDLNRLIYQGPFTDLAILLFNVTEGTSVGYAHLLHTLAELPDPFAHDPLKLWKTIAGTSPLAPFDMDTLHMWAIRDNPELYNTLFTADHAAESLLFGTACAESFEVDDTGEDKEDSEVNVA